MKIKIITFIISLCFTISSYSQTDEEIKILDKIIYFADSLFKIEEYEKALIFYERAYHISKWEYPYEQIRHIKDGNLIIRKKQKEKNKDE